MRRLAQLLALLTCANICERLGYEYTVLLKPDKKSCYCADKVDRADPMVIPNWTAKWYEPHSLPPAEDE